ncbi:hypothetical protein [Paenibacillus odorifer]|uniref:hypothetical protein n=1 Tax=Paenibacillus odorifer TaxID=189426 RepID=UPI00096DA5BE|nr:hypothetical protein [Paenibacillus odorifer]OMD61031.1 hypothetical protein BSK55_06740 [Paenibacillus odorifer]
MLITISQACEFYRVSKSVLEDWITVSGFPVVQVRGVNTGVYDYKSQNWRVASDEADAWVDERVKRIVEGATFALFIGYPEEPSRQSKIIIDQAEPEFLRNYLYLNMPAKVKAAVEKAEFEDLRCGFVNGHKRSRWFEAAGGILGYSALETLKQEGDKLNNIVGLEARLYGLYLRSITNAQNKLHPDFKIYVSGLLGAGTFDHWNNDVKESAVCKYGSSLIRGLVIGSSYCGINRSRAGGCFI